MIPLRNGHDYTDLYFYLEKKIGILKKKTKNTKLYNKQNFIYTLKILYYKKKDIGRWSSSSEIEYINDKIMCKIGKEITNIFISRISNYNLENYNFLDYGAGSGEYSLFISDLAAKHKKNTINYNLDIDNYINEDQAYDRIRNSFIDNKTINSINIIDDNSLDLVIASQSLHHVMFEEDKKKTYEQNKLEFLDKLDKIIYSIVKKLKIGGLFYVREHDITDIPILKTVVYEHLIHDLEESDCDSSIYDFIENYHSGSGSSYYGFYFSKETLHSIIEKYGMKILFSCPNIGKNSSQIYNSIYEKNSEL